MYFQSSWLLCSRKVHGKWGYLCNIFVVVAIVWRAVSEKNFFNSCSCRHLRRLLDLLLQWNSIIWVWNPEVVVIHVKYNITVENVIWEIPNSRMIINRVKFSLWIWSIGFMTKRDFSRFNILDRRIRFSSNHILSKCTLLFV